MSNISHEQKYGVPFIQKSNVYFENGAEQIETMIKYRKRLDELMIETKGFSKKELYFHESKQITKFINKQL